jgi:hypothetical protein
LRFFVKILTKKLEKYIINLLEEIMEGRHPVLVFLSRLGWFITIASILLLIPTLIFHIWKMAVGGIAIGIIIMLISSIDSFFPRT